MVSRASFVGLVWFYLILEYKLKRKGFLQKEPWESIKTLA